MAEEQIEHLGAAIQAAREGKKWSRARLAREIPVDPKTIERWEKGTSGGAHDSLSAVAGALDCTADDLLASAIQIGRDKRGPDGEKTDGSPLDLFNAPGTPTAVAEAVEKLRKDLHQEIVETRTQLLAEIEKVRSAPASPRSKKAPPGRRPKSKSK